MKYAGQRTRRSRTDAECALPRPCPRKGHSKRCLGTIEAGDWHWVCPPCLKDAAETMRRRRRRIADSKIRVNKHRWRTLRRLYGLCTWGLCEEWAAIKTAKDRTRRRIAFCEHHQVETNYRQRMSRADKALARRKSAD